MCFLCILFCRPSILVMIAVMVARMGVWEFDYGMIVFKRHRYDDIIMGFYGKAFNNGLQAKAAGSKPILFPANQNLGRSGLYHS